MKDVAVEMKRLALPPQIAKRLVNRKRSLGIVDAAAETGADMVELHTGKLSNAFAEKIEQQELHNLREAAKAASELKMQVNAGHGINYTNISLIHKISHLTELNIGHSIISRAVFVGLESAVREMLLAMEEYKG